MHEQIILDETATIALNSVCEAKSLRLAAITAEYDARFKQILLQFLKNNFNITELPQIWKINLREGDVQLDKAIFDYIKPD